jgi:uncharacterized protein (DUF1501 family)
VTKDFITLPRRVGLAKLGAAKGATYYYRPSKGIAVEQPADIAQLARTYASHPAMKMRVCLSDSRHTIVVVENARLSYGYQIEF